MNGIPESPMFADVHPANLFTLTGKRCLRRCKMAILYVTLYDNDVQPIMMPLPYTIVGKKYVYGPTANGKKRRPEPLRIPWWKKMTDNYKALFDMFKK